MLLLMGTPIFLLELLVGQYSGMGPDKVFRHLAPIFTGLGYCCLVVIYLITIYYMVIVSWTSFYFFASFTLDLGYGRCNNDFNSDGKLPQTNNFAASPFNTNSSCSITFIQTNSFQDATVRQRKQNAWKITLTITEHVF